MIFFLSCWFTIITNTVKKKNKIIKLIQKKYKLESTGDFCLKINEYLNKSSARKIKRGKVNLTAHVTDFHCHFYYILFFFVVWGKKTDMNLRLAFYL